MVAVDTNVLVRLLTQDDPKQAAAAQSLFAAEPIWIAKTVLLETGWVLRSLYGIEESSIRNAFTKLLGLKNVHTGDEPSVAAALALAGHGIERRCDAFATFGWDRKYPSSPGFIALLIFILMGLSGTPPGAAFVSFDQSFTRRAKRAGATEVCGVSDK